MGLRSFRAPLSASRNLVYVKSNPSPNPNSSPHLTLTLNLPLALALGLDIDLTLPLTLLLTLTCHAATQIVSSLPEFNKKLTQKRNTRRSRRKSQQGPRRSLGEGNATAKEISTARLEGVVRKVTNVLVAVEQDTMVLTLALTLNPKP